MNTVEGATSISHVLQERTPSVVKAAASIIFLEIRDYSIQQREHLKASYNDGSNGQKASLLL